MLSYQTVGEGAKEIERRLAEEVWTAGKLDVIDELIAPDLIGYSPTDGEIHGPDGFRELVERYRSAFSNIEFRNDRVIAEGDWVAVSWTARGTHTGELMGIAPTGRDVTTTGMSFDRIADGKIAESHGLFDALGMLQQLGAIPAGMASAEA